MAGVQPLNPQELGVGKTRQGQRPEEVLPLNVSGGQGPDPGVQVRAQKFIPQSQGKPALPRAPSSVGRSIFLARPLLGNLASPRLASPRSFSIHFSILWFSSHLPSLQHQGAA